MRDQAADVELHHTLLHRRRRLWQRQAAAVLTAGTLATSEEELTAMTDMERQEEAL